MFLTKKICTKNNNGRCSLRSPYPLHLTSFSPIHLAGVLRSNTGAFDLTRPYQRLQPKMTEVAPLPSREELQRTFSALNNQVTAFMTSAGLCYCDGTRPPCTNPFCYCDDDEHPEDEPVDEDLSDEALRRILNRLTTRARGVAESLTPCDCASRPAPVGPTNLFDLPAEIRDIIWGYAISPRGADIVTWPIDHSPDEPGTPPRVTRFVVGQAEGYQVQYTYTPYNPRDNMLGLLRANRQMNAEAGSVFFRGNTFFFSGDTRPDVHHGVMAMWAFLQDRSEAQLQDLRRVHLNLRQGATNDQALTTRRPFGRTDGSELIDPLFDFIRTRLPSLNHLSLDFNGWPPDMRTDPVSAPLPPCRCFLHQLFEVLTPSAVDRGPSPPRSHAAAKLCPLGPTSAQYRASASAFAAANREASQHHTGQSHLRHSTH